MNALVTGCAFGLAVVFIGYAFGLWLDHRIARMAAIEAAERQAREDEAAGYRFTCVECRRSILSFGHSGSLSPFNLCSACLFHPGWYHYPELRGILAPNMTDDEAKRLGR